MSIKFSIVIPVLNNLHFTKACLEDILSQPSDDTEVIVVDNASSDETPQYMEHIEGVRYIRNESNLGCAKSWNQGVRLSQGEWVVILNNDVRLPKNWLQALHRFATDGDYAIVSPAMRHGELNYDFQEYARSYCETMKDVCRNWTPSGVCFMVRRDVFDTVGYFDENFIVGQYEDADFFRRSKLNGLKMASTGSAFIHHFGSITQKSIKKENQSNDYATINRNYYRKKWKLGWGIRHFERYGSNS